ANSMIRGISAIALLVIIVLALSAVAGKEQQTSTRYNYHESNEALINAGMQALFICNGLFVSNRTMDQLYAAELKMDLMRLAPPDEIKIDREGKTVAVGESGKSPGPTMRAAHREGLGCVVMGPEQSFSDIDKLPILKMAPPAGDASRL